MILANQVECLVPALPSATETIVNCTIAASDGASAWDIWSTIANWAIFLIAAGALWVSNKQRKQSDVYMEETLMHSKSAHDELLVANKHGLDIQLKAAKDVAGDQMEATHKANQEQLDASYRATQAQLDASREATTADLDERKNSRELDMTAEFVSALDRLQITAAMDTSEEGRGLAMHQAAMDAMAAASRFHLFVGHSRALMQFQQIFISMLQSFAPATIEDFESREFDRLVKLQSTLRSEIVEFQKTRQISTMFAALLGALKSGNFDFVDSAMGVHPIS